MTFWWKVLVFSAALALLGGHSLFAQTDTAQWVGIGPPGPGREVYALALDPSSTSTIFAGTRTQGVLKTTDGGRSWTPMNNGLISLFVFDLVIHPLTPQTVYASTDSGVFKSTDRGGSWTSILLGFRNIALDPLNESTVYAAACGALLKSTDGGANWSTMGERLSGCPTTIAVDPVSPSTLYMGMSYEIVKSLDGGRSWFRLHSMKRGGVGEEVRQFVIDPFSPSTIYASTFDSGGVSPGTVLPTGSVLKSEDAGVTWRRVDAGLPREGVFPLATDPSSPATIYTATFGRVFKSTNAGETWTSQSAGLPSGSFIYRLAIHPRLPSTVYAATLNGGVYKMPSVAVSGNCTPDATAFCLANGLFRTQVQFTTPQGNGTGQAVALTSDTGAFWFFNSSNLELVVKILDGRAANGFFWVFYGSLTNVEFTLTVTATQTGTTKTYVNRQGQLASFADTRAF